MESNVCRARSAALLSLDKLRVVHVTLWIKLILIISLKHRQTFYIESIESLLYIRREQKRISPHVGALDLHDPWYPRVLSWLDILVCLIWRACTFSLLSWVPNIFASLVSDTAAAFTISGNRQDLALLSDTQCPATVF